MSQVLRQLLAVAQGLDGLEGHAGDEFFFLPGRHEVFMSLLMFHDVSIFFLIKITSDGYWVPCN